MTQASSAISQTATEQLKTFALFAYLMGSAETPRFNKDSDVDLAVFWLPVISEEQKRAKQLDLMQIFDRDVDLVSLNKIDVIFAHQVLDTGRLLFCESAGDLLNWKMNMMSAYPDFKRSRKVIEEQILTRKKYV